jgi:hypothetical protein
MPAFWLQLKQPQGFGLQRCRFTYLLKARTRIVPYHHTGVLRQPSLTQGVNVDSVNQTSG